jgi:hypothetical protein
MIAKATHGILRDLWRFAGFAIKAVAGNSAR